MITTAHNITDILNHAKSVSEVVYISTEEYKNNFSVEHMFSEYGEYAYECKVYGSVSRITDREVGQNEVYTEDYDIEIINCYDEEGEIIDLTREQEILIEEQLKHNSQIELY